ncbi:MAG: alkaline phosphatase family protein [Verrucomicrobia bacterium]|nr:alkaline phosphatase family protein [Verrucomicrobiota bacterium]
MRKVFWLVTLFSTLAAVSRSIALPPKGEADHVVLIVWDGMRPDFVTPQYTPVLFDLATNGVFFKNHHAAFISSTEVNGTAIATGCYPETSGVYANNDYRPMLGWMGPNATEGLDSIRRADFLTGGNYLLVPTAAELIQKAGFPTVAAGTKPVIILHDRAAKRSKGAARDSVLLYHGQTIPKPVVESFEEKQIPSNAVPNSAADNWTAKALTQHLWKKAVPKYSVLWLSDPDATQHSKGVGAEEALAAITNCDKILGSVIKALKEKKVLDKTDLMIASDHGFSTVRRGPDVMDILKKAKFKATRKYEDPERGEVLVVGHGGSVSLYVWEHDEQVIQNLVTFLQGTDFAGVIFTRKALTGTFPMRAARIGTTNVTPDIIFSMRWSEDRNDQGAPGLLIGDGGGKGSGTHASLSRYDMHNTLIASGPDFKKGLVDEWPSGSMDIAPTTLWILGVPQSERTPMDGRVLEEALAKGDVPESKPETKTMEATCQLGWLQWRQYLKYTEFDHRLYLDEGNASLEMK